MKQQMNTMKNFVKHFRRLGRMEKAKLTTEKAKYIHALNTFAFTVLFYAGILLAILAIFYL